jgi:hypothetical protein
MLWYRVGLAAFVAAWVWSNGSAAEDVRYYEKDGVTYCETRRIVEERVPETRLEERSQTVYRSEPTTEMKETVRTSWNPVTEYTWEAFWVGRWNPLVQPYLAYRYVPRTRWEQKTETVQTPVTTVRVVPETKTVQCPVTTYRTVQKEVITRVAVSPRPAGNLPQGNQAPMLAQRQQVGGVRRLDNDPPRYGTAGNWHSAGTLR